MKIIITCDNWLLWRLKTFQVYVSTICAHCTYKYNKLIDLWREIFLISTWIFNRFITHVTNFTPYTHSFFFATHTVHTAINRKLLNFLHHYKAFLVVFFSFLFVFFFSIFFGANLAKWQSIIIMYLININRIRVKIRKKKEDQFVY